MATAEGNAVADKGSAGADTSVKGVDRSVVDTVTDADVGATEAQRRGVVADTDVARGLSTQILQDAIAEGKQIRQNAITHANNVNTVTLQLLTNMVSDNNKTNMRAIKMVADNASEAISAEIAEDVGSDA